MFNLRQLHSRSRLQRRACTGMTLIELMIAMVIGTIITGAVILTAMFINQSFSTVINYSELDRYSQNTMDTMSRDIRNSVLITPSSTNQITLTDTSSNITVYAWDSTTTAFTRSNSSSSKIMMTNCVYLSFNYFMRVPTNNLGFVPAGASTVKLVSVSWLCSRQVYGYGNRLNTESVQTANIVSRN